MFVCKFIYEMGQNIMLLIIFGNVNLLKILALILYQIYLYHSIVMTAIFNYIPKTKTISRARRFRSAVYLQIVLHVLLFNA
jgi:hypothetical protein